MTYNNIKKVGVTDGDHFLNIINNNHHPSNYQYNNKQKRKNK